MLLNCSSVGNKTISPTEGKHSTPRVNLNSLLLLERVPTGLRHSLRSGNGKSIKPKSLNCAQGNWNAQ